MKTIPEIEYISHYEEDGEITVLIAPSDQFDDRRYNLIVDPQTKKIKEVFAFTSNDDGIEENDEYTPTAEDLDEFNRIVNDNL